MAILAGLTDSESFLACSTHTSGSLISRCTNLWASRVPITGCLDAEEYIFLSITGLDLTGAPPLVRGLGTIVQSTTSWGDLPLDRNFLHLLKGYHPSDHKAN